MYHLFFKINPIRVSPKTMPHALLYHTRDIYEFSSPPLPRFFRPSPTFPVLRN